MQQFRTLLVAAGCLYLSFAPAVAAEPMTSGHATGTFDVQMSPETVNGKTPDPDMGQMGMRKNWQGDLDGKSTGTMIGAGAPARGSAGYVAMEKFTGTLAGHTGSFILQQFGTMAENKLQMTISVVPATGTDQLEGLSGTMTIRTSNGQHYYDFDYALPAVQ
jgi:Protein of unknown function (DUF3224)